jgi:hypothetical protein
VRKLGWHAVLFFLGFSLQTWPSWADWGQKYSADRGRCFTGIRLSIAMTEIDWGPVPPLSSTCDLPWSEARDAVGAVKGVGTGISV